MDLMATANAMTFAANFVALTANDVHFSDDSDDEE